MIREVWIEGGFTDAGPQVTFWRGAKSRKFIPSCSSLARLASVVNVEMNVSFEFNGQMTIIERRNWIDNDSLRRELLYFRLANDAARLGMFAGSQRALQKAMAELKRMRQFVRASRGIDS